jgi:hypothetical protein
MTYSCSSEFWPSAGTISLFDAADNNGPSKTTNLGLNLFDLCASNIVSAAMSLKKTQAWKQCCSHLVHGGRHDDCGALRAFKLRMKKDAMRSWK